MIKKFLACVFLMTILFLSSCANVPDEVREEMNRYENSSVGSDNSDYEFIYIDKSEINDNATIALQKDYSQFKIDDNINIDELNKISIMKFKYLENFEENYNNVLKLFFTQEQIMNQEISPNINSDASTTYSFWNETDKMYGCVGDNGFIAMLKPEAFDISFGYSEPNIKIYHVDRNDDLSDIYYLNDGNCSVGEAVEYINNWLSAEYKKISSDYDYKVKTVIVRKHEEKYLFEIYIELLYDGIPLDSLTLESATDEKNKTMYTAYNNSAISIQMINVNQIDSFTNLTGILKPVETDNVKKCISLESALKYCENTFTDFKNVTISDIGIKYTLKPIYNYMGVESEDDNGNKIYKNMEFDCSAGITVDLRPVWEFIIDVDPSEFLRDGETNTYGDTRKYIYIDMVTGELHYNMDIVLQGLGA